MGLASAPLGTAAAALGDETDAGAVGAAGASAGAEVVVGARAGPGVGAVAGVGMVRGDKADAAAPAASAVPGAPLADVLRSRASRMALRFASSRSAAASLAGLALAARSPTPLTFGSSEVTDAAFGAAVSVWPFASLGATLGCGEWLSLGETTEGIATVVARGDTVAVGGESGGLGCDGAAALA